MIGTVVGRTTEDVSIEFTFYFSRFRGSKHQEPLFCRSMSTSGPGVAATAVPMTGAVVGRTAKHVSIKFTFYFSRFHKSRYQKPFFRLSMPTPGPGVMSRAMANWGQWCSEAFCKI